MDWRLMKKTVIIYSLNLESGVTVVALVNFLPTILYITGLPNNGFIFQGSNMLCTHMYMYFLYP